MCVYDYMRRDRSPRRAPREGQCAMLCYAMLCYAMLCYAWLGFAMR